ncbi:VWA domain-containing protein [Verrucomicrobiota bacterium sgz303538]
MTWNSIFFAHPWMLWGLLALPLLALLKGAPGAAAAVKFSSLQPFRDLGRPRKARAGWFVMSLLLGALACFIVALARPQQAKTISRVEASGIDILLALDVSRSMLAEDFSIGRDRANRLEAVKQVTEKFINGRPNDRIGIVAFAGQPYLVSPLTLNHDWLLKNLDRLRIGMVEDGTAIGSAIASAANRLKEQKESKSKIIVLLTDGDNNAGKVTPVTAAEAARALGIKIYTIVAGSRGYAPVPVQDVFGRTVYRQVLVEVDEASMKQIAQIGGGQFYRATDSRSLQQIFDQIDQLEKSKIEMSESRQVHDLFPWALATGAILLALHAVATQTIGRTLP